MGWMHGGFLSHPDLAAEGETRGKWGFLDQQAALRGVQAHAAHFGGDPARVAIFGESAGGAVGPAAHRGPGLAGAGRVFTAVSFPEVPGGPVYQEHPFFYFPTLDGVTFVEQPLAALRAGHVAEAAMVLGSNTDEGLHLRREPSRDAGDQRVERDWVPR